MRNDISPIQSFGEAQSSRPCAPAANILDRISPLQNILGIKTAHGPHVVTPMSSQTEDAQFHHFQIDLPGVASGGVKLHANGSLLTLEAARAPSPGLCELIFRATIVPSGNVDATKATASLRDGVLMISIPKVVGAAAAGGGANIAIT
jgi:HSP20 family molecular chaperone IbpA